MTTATITRPTPTAAYHRRGACLGKRRPDCTADVHGTDSAYKKGCRCPHARNAYRIYQKRLREGRNTPRLVDATGTHRRIRALWALGHNSATIGATIGLSEHHVQRIVHAREFVTYATWHLIDRAYRELSMIPGTADRTRSRAQRAGYAPPLAWEGVDIDDPQAQPAETPEAEQDGYDPVTVAFAVEGRLTYEQIKAHRPDLIETVRRLARTLGDHEISRHLHWPGADSGDVGGRNRGQNTVCNFRKRNGIPGPEKWEAVYAYGTRSRARKGTRTAKAA